MLSILAPLSIAGVIAMALVQLSASTALPMVPQYCRPADQTSTIISAQVKSMLTASTGPEAENRIALHLPQVPDSAAVVIVADESVCQRAAGAYDSVLVNKLQLPPTQRQVYVIRADTFYVVADPTTKEMGTEWITAMLFTDDFVHVGTWGS
jgi:hypothetical protein